MRVRRVQSHSVGSEKSATQSQGGISAFTKHNPHCLLHWLELK